MKTLIKILLFIDNKLYQLIDSLACAYNKGIHPKHEITKYYNFFLENIESGDEILDVGCGNGYVSYQCATKAKKVIGVEITRKNYELANKNYQKDNLQFIQADATTYNFASRFDKIILSNVLEHIQDRIPFLQSLHKLSDILLVRVPMIDRYWTILYKKNMGVEYRTDKTHYIEYTFDSFKKEIEDAGWRVDSHSIQFGEIWAVVKNKI